MERALHELAPEIAGREPLSASAASSAVSWGAILAGAAGAASLSLVLAFLGFGLGMSSVSPWAGQGTSAQNLGTGSILWVTLTQIAAASLGGYLAGRLRTRWIRTHTDEVYFRDTAHGFLAWAIATLATAAVFVSVIGAIASGTAKLGSAALVSTGAVAAAAATEGADDADASRGYVLDTLFRRSAAAPAPAPVDATQPAYAGSGTSGTGSSDEAARIFAHSVQVGSLSAEDARYLGQLITERTGLTQAESEARARAAYSEWEKVISTAKETADKARKVAAYAALWLFISLLGGAFFASYCATWGGKRRDLVD